MSTDSTVVPSDSRWSTFSVWPPSAPMTVSSVTVDHRNASSIAAARGRGRVVRSAALVATPAQTACTTWRARNAGSPRASNHATRSTDGTPDRPGRGSRADPRASSTARSRIRLHLLVEGLPDTGPAHGQIAQPQAGRRRDGIRDRRRSWNHGCLADALRAERAVGRGYL